ncbi:MAG: hypothetical protein A2103_01460 [Gammaproteobacteria bacterium GWF2_41_13]|nr:MAG: hypothetical protein A2103_01460 [Gammaproteobacteria bacterium GWF2_41_13]
MRIEGRCRSATNFTKLIFFMRISFLTMPICRLLGKFFLQRGRDHTAQFLTLFVIPRLDRGIQAYFLDPTVKPRGDKIREHDIKNLSRSNFIPQSLAHSPRSSKFNTRLFLHHD